MSAGRSVNSQSQHWGTPKKYVEAIKEFFEGSVELDPCSNGCSIVNARIEFMLPKHDGLKEEWSYNTVYVNPPYGADRKNGTTIKNWLQKCVISRKKYNSEILALIPVATNTMHWKQNIFGKANAICFLYDTRLKFLENGLEGGKGAPMACAMVYWGDNFAKFSNIFLRYGAVIDISALIDVEISETNICQMRMKFSANNSASNDEEIFFNVPQR